MKAKPEKKRSGPYAMVKSGNVAIPIYRVRNKGYDEFRVVWRDKENVRRQKACSDEAEARRFAERLQEAVATGGEFSLTGPERHEYQDANSAIAGLDTPLNLVAREWAESVRRLGSVSIKEAVNFYLKHNVGTQTRTVREVVTELIGSKRSPSKNKKPASEKYITDLESRLGRFEESFQCNIADVRPEQIVEFLDDLPDISGRTWFNYARLIRTLFNFAQAKRYTPPGIDPMEGIDIEYDDDGEIEIFTPEELKKLFAAARSELIPFLAIAAFSGVRSGEISRLDWKDISHTHITVEAGRAKTRSRRVIALQPNLAKWLAPHRQQSGPVAPFANMSKQLLWLAEDAKIQWKHNALRRSFISYRLAKTNDENLTAVEAGNSPTMIQHHYRQIKDHTGRVITPELADVWFSIAPETSEKIVPMVATEG